MNFFKNMKVRTKLIMGFTSLIIMLVLCNLAGYTTAQTIVDNQQNGNNEAKEIVNGKLEDTSKKIEEGIASILMKGNTATAANDIAEVVKNQVGTLVNESFDTVRETSDQSSRLHGFGVFTMVVTLLFIATTIAIEISIIGTIRKSLEALANASKNIANGKVDFTVEKKRDDEFGVLTDEFNTVIENVRAQSEIAEEVASGNLCVIVKPRSEEDMLGNALKKMVKRNHAALSNINDSAFQVMTSSSQVASASEALAQGSTEQASAIEEITVSINDIAEKTNENATKAADAKKLMSKVIDDVNRENEQMKEMVDAMNDINKSSENISKIIKVIDDIAFQTNILALNAAVEAARAGEVGKGFAVVAEEVRSLAAKSSQAAAETAELIENSIKTVEAGSEIANETAKSLAEMTSQVKETEGIVNDIAEASNYQAVAITQVNQAIEQVSQVVQNNSATSEECAAASIELSDQSKRMRDMIAVYKLSGGNTDKNGWNDDDVSDRNEQIISLRDGFGKY